jgi:methyl-accepting chemotaxis protein
MGKSSLVVRITLGIAVGLVAIACLVAGFSVYTTKNYLQEEARNKINERYLGMQEMLNIYKANALGHANAISRNSKIIEAAKRRDAQALFATTTSLMKESQLDYMVITDPKGFVMIRTHEPGKLPKADDSIANQVNVAQAILGKAFVGIEEGKVVKLSVRAGAPLYDDTGILVGVVSTGYVISQNAIVDMAKKMFGADVALFLNNERVAATATNSEGKRLTGTPIGNPTILQTVLTEGKIYTGINQIAGKNHVSTYGPLLGANGKVIGMIGLAIPTSLTEQVTQSLSAQIIIASTVALFIVVFASAFFIRRLIKPLQLLLERMSAVADGNLTFSQLTIDSRDEIGRLASGYNIMLKHLRTLIHHVSRSAEQVAGSAQQLKANAEQSAQVANQVAQVITDVALGAETQLKAVDATASVVGHMSSRVQQIAANINSVADTSAQSADAARDGSQAVEKAIIQMVQVENTVSRSTAVVAKLGERSKEIGDIITTISGIAGQTNLLALNAAIEAARAGEQGRGFAVVADEVRKLAEQSHDAAKRIASLITEIQADTEKAVLAMSDGSKEVRTGGEVVNEAGVAFQKIFNSINNVSIQVREISAAIQQMADGSDQIVASVREIDSISRDAASQAQRVSSSTIEQSATMKAIAASSHELAGMASELTQAVGAFKL